MSSYTTRLLELVRPSEDEVLKSLISAFPHVSLVRCARHGKSGALRGGVADPFAVVRDGGDFDREHKIY